MKFRLLDLFSGIGGFSLGLERSEGFKTVAFCEIDPFCRKVLAKHWPSVPQYHDIRELTAAQLAADGIGVDAICGGFPCQDISIAGSGAGIEGERSGLWSEFARLIGELRPDFAIVENVSALLGRGLGNVLGDLAALGYGSEAHCIPAAAVGAPHRRDRVWIVANANGTGLSDGRQAGVSASESQAKWRMAFTQSQRCCSPWWAIEPNVDRMANGIPRRVDRLRSLGNAVVPQIPELIGRAIMASIA
jgi:DNA (cytosine-5)-methyltransferase 1